MASTASSSAVGGGSSSSAIFADTVTGSHVLRIDGYSETTGSLGVGGYISSGKFFVGGHSWSIAYYPDGFDEAAADWISFFLFLDDRAGKKGVKVKARFKLSLLDQEGSPVPEYSKPCSMVRAFQASGSNAWGHKGFIKRKDLQESKYLRDDCFRITCDITVIRGFCKAATRKFVAVPPSDLHRDLGCLLSAGKGADVTFKVGDEVFAAHKNVLAARSSVFMAELLGAPMKEKTTARVKIHDMEPDVFRALLHFIYTDSLPEMRKEEEIVMAQHLLVAADRYDLKRLKLICEDKLCSNINKNTAAITLVLAEQHGCHGLKEACFAFLSPRGILKAIMDTDGYDHLRSSCPSLHEELVAKLDVVRSSKIIRRSFWCFSFQ